MQITYAQKKKPSVILIFALATGLTMIAFTAIMYLGGIDLYLSNLGYIGYLLLITMASIATVARKKANGGWLAFPEALKTAFLILFIGLAVQTLGMWLLMNVIDPHFKDLVSQRTLAKWAELMKKGGLSEHEIEETIAKQKDTDSLAFSPMMVALALYSIGFFVIALIIATIVRKNKPENYKEAGF